MQEIGVETTILAQILSGEKTIEARLGKPKFLKIRTGDILSLREDVWENDSIVREVHNRASIKVTQLLYFESFDELFSAIDYKATLPTAESKVDALNIYRQFYSPEDEYEYGVIAITFKLQ